MNKKVVIGISFIILLIFGFYSSYYFSPHKDIGRNLNTYYEILSLCTSLCIYAKKDLNLTNITNVCLSFPPSTLTGRYWTYNNWDCAIGSYNVCNRNNNYILLDDQCNVSKIVENGKIIS